ncbi:MAG TPA: Zn-dependent hydrolase, partial [Halococcus sp.]|nr:Zn-dependent hydrolase [Halococcus sp.]
LTLTNSDQNIRDWWVEQLEEAGLTVWVDAVGNIFGRREGIEPSAAPVLIGSHLDSQPNGGIYDGALGCIAALEIVRTLNERSVETDHPIEVVNWTNEEGSRFQPAMFGSGVWAGQTSIEEAYDTTDSEGIRFEDALEGIGYLGDEPAEPHEEYEAYLELHIEQGPRLEATGADVGVVTGIVGFTWGEVTLNGEANHTGTTPMDHRSDALVAASDVVTGIRRLPATLDPEVVATTGSINLEPDSINVIPGEVSFTWDARAPTDDLVRKARERVLSEVEYAADREGVNSETVDRQHASTVTFPERTVNAVWNATDQLGLDSMELTSGAGHDATHAAAVTDAAMVFAVSEGGYSHSPKEFTTDADCYAAANTLGTAAINLAAPEVRLE